MIIMPTRKPDEVIVHRIELQRKERDLLEGYLISHGIGNVLNGVGAVLMPFSNAAGVILGAIIAKEGVDYVLDWMERDRLKNISDCEKEYNAYYAQVNQASFQERREDESVRAWQLRTSLISKETYIAECMKKKSDARLNPLQFPWSPFSKLKNWVDELAAEYDPDVKVGSGAIGSVD